MNVYVSWPHNQPWGGTQERNIRFLMIIFSSQCHRGLSPYSPDESKEYEPMVFVCVHSAAKHFVRG